MRRCSLAYLMVLVVFAAIQMACIRSIVETAWPYREMLFSLWKGWTR